MELEDEGEETGTASSAYRMLAVKCSNLRGLTLILRGGRCGNTYPVQCFGALERIRGLEEARILRKSEEPSLQYHTTSDMQGWIADELKKAWKKPRDQNTRD